MSAKTTEDIILNAATRVFTQKGFSGARTCEIAKEAGINRSLLHYYYRDKQTMFNLIFETRFKELFTGVISILGSEDSLEVKIRKIIEHEISQLILNPDLPMFILSEVAQNPQFFSQLTQKFGINAPKNLLKFENMVKKEVENKTIRKIDGRQLFLHIMSICIYPFLASPVIGLIMKMNETEFCELMEKRKEEAVTFVLNGIKFNYEKNSN